MNNWSDEPKPSGSMRVDGHQVSVVKVVACVKAAESHVSRGGLQIIQLDAYKVRGSLKRLSGPESTELPSCSHGSQGTPASSYSLPGSYPTLMPEQGLEPRLGKVGRERQR